MLDNLIGFYIINHSSKRLSNQIENDWKTLKKQVPSAEAAKCYHFGTNGNLSHYLNDNNIQIDSMPI